MLFICINSPLYLDIPEAVVSAPPITGFPVIFNKTLTAINWKKGLNKKAKSLIYWKIVELSSPV